MSALQSFMSTNHIYVILKAYSLQSEYQGYQTNLFWIFPDPDAKIKVTEPLWWQSAPGTIYLIC